MNIKKIKSLNLLFFFKFTILFVIFVFLSISYSCNKHDNVILQSPDVKIGKYAGNLTLPYYEEINSFNPYNCFNPTEKYISSLLYDSLIYFNSDKSKFYYWIAEDIDKIDDNSLIIKIKKGMKSSTGNIIDADYILSTFLLLKNISGELQDVKLEYLKNYKFEKIDEYSFKITKIANDNLEKSDKKDITYFFDILQLPILPISIVKKIKKNADYFYKFGTIQNKSEETFFPEEFTGPWVLQSVKDNKLILIKNIYYNFFDKKGNRLPYFEKIIFIKSDDLNIEFQSFLKDNIGAILLTEKDYKNLKKYIINYNVKKIYNKFRYSILLLNLNSSNNKLSSLFRQKSFRFAFYKLLHVENIYKNNSNYILPFDLNISKIGYNKNLINKRLKEINKQKIDEIKSKLKDIYTLYVYNKDKYMIDVSKKLINKLKKEGIQFNYVPIDLTTMVAKIYADNSWNFLLLNFQGNLKNNKLLNFLDPFSKNHIFNLGKDKIPEELEIYNNAKNIYKIDFLYNPNIYLKNLSDSIFKNMVFIPVGTELYYIVYNKALQNFSPYFGDEYLDYSSYKLIYSFKDK